MEKDYNNCRISFSVVLVLVPKSIELTGMQGKWDVVYKIVHLGSRRMRERVLESDHL